MIVKRGGQYKTIDPKEYGIWLAAGFVKVSEGSLGDATPKREKAKREELPRLTLEEVHETDKFVKLDSEESLAAPHGESEIEPLVDEDGCYGGVCELEDAEEVGEEEPLPKGNGRRNKNKNK